jgi:hypothetical protein
MTDRAAPIRRREKAEKYIIPMLRILLKLENNARLAQKLNIDAGFWARICNDDQTQLPEKRRQEARDLCRTADPPVALPEDYFNLTKEQIVAFIPADHPRYESLRAAAGLPPLPPSQSRTFDAFSALVGSYARFLIARNGKTSTLTMEHFDIRPHEKEPDKLVISQLDYEFENRNPRGEVHVVSRNDTIEIRINYESDRDPIGTFLAPYPSGHPLTHFLAIALDIHYNTRNVLAKPVLFVKLDQPLNSKAHFLSKERLYKRVRQVFSKYIHYEAGRMELSIPKSSPEDDIAEIRAELERLRGSEAS